MADLDDLHSYPSVDGLGMAGRAARWEAEAFAAAHKAAGWELPPPESKRHVTVAVDSSLRGLAQAAVDLLNQAGAPPALLWVWEVGDFGLPAEPDLYLLLTEPPPEWTPPGPCVDARTVVATEQHPAAALLALVTLLCRLTGQPLPPFQQADLDGALLAGCLPETPTAKNPAKQLALRLNEQMIRFWAEGPDVAVAWDWCVRLLWYAEVLTDVTTTAQWAYMLSMARLPRFLVNTTTIIRFPAPPSELATRLETLMQRRRLHLIGLPPVTTGSPMGRILTLLAHGEWVAFYLAMHNDVDPSSRVALQFLGLR